MKLNEVIAKYGNQEVDESKIKEVLGVKESKVWKPAKREDYYYFTESGIGFTNMNIEESPRWNFGNCFKTKEEAEFARDKQIFLTKFERYLRENEDEPVGWGNSSHNKYCIRIDHCDNYLGIYVVSGMQQQGTIFTTNKYALEKFIKDNESDIKKYMFGVE